MEDGGWFGSYSEEYSFMATTIWYSMDGHL